MSNGFNFEYPIYYQIKKLIFRHKKLLLTPRIYSFSKRNLNLQKKKKNRSKSFQQHFLRCYPEKTVLSIQHKYLFGICVTKFICVLKNILLTHQSMVILTKCFDKTTKIFRCMNLFSLTIIILE